MLNCDGLGIPISMPLEGKTSLYETVGQVLPFIQWFTTKTQRFWTRGGAPSTLASSPSSEPLSLCTNAKVVVVPPKSSLPKAVEWPEVRPLGCFLLPAAAWSQNSQPQTELTSRQRPLHSRAVDLSPLSLHPASGKAHACGPRACRKGVGQSHTSLLCLRRRKPPPLRRVQTP